ncbi:DUF1822 family protein [Merismopedia glauca]|uniref:Uncharacterized protein n=1 Tax=Merismopedia glauca CCAP 1448/3 TaxID=1296344 RepID=A0A2T1BWL0_9CYAN|nr:DUF1822 family protein [Merismopedia glauca]PSB00395.1 hypothetical protein C7B64_23755 [Merismopedia glauca CCAP 1448/3]
MNYPRPIDILLPISPKAKIKTWKKSQGFSSPYTRWRAYLNRLCLEAVFRWLNEDSDEQPATFCSLPSCWEKLNGSTINLGNKRLAIFPTEVWVVDELLVEKEWVDDESLAADYYLGVQIDEEESLITIWGYTTHKKLKEQGTYHERDGTYSLERDKLIPDLIVLLVTLKYC